MAASVALISLLVYLQQLAPTIVLLILMLYYVENYLLVRHSMLPLCELTSTRPIKQVDTLIIGDICSKRYLKRRYDLSHTLLITAPGRSFYASKLILEHVASRLDGKQVCIITKKNNKKKVQELDFPYLSQLTKMELGVNSNHIKKELYFFIYPIELIQYFLGLMLKPKERVCEDAQLASYCERKGFKITVLYI